MWAHDLLIQSSLPLLSVVLFREATTATDWALVGLVTTRGENTWQKIISVSGLWKKELLYNVQGSSCEKHHSLLPAALSLLGLFYSLRCWLALFYLHGSGSVISFRPTADTFLCFQPFSPSPFCQFGSECPDRGGHFGHFKWPSLAQLVVPLPGFCWSDTVWVRMVRKTLKEACVSTVLTFTK